MDSQAVGLVRFETGAQRFGYPHIWPPSNVRMSYVYLAQACANSRARIQHDKVQSLGDRNKYLQASTHWLGSLDHLKLDKFIDYTL